MFMQLRLLPGDSSDSVTNVIDIVTITVFLLEGSKSDVWDYLVSLPYVENVQNL